jgi:signal peptide peptidase SppA
VKSYPHVVARLFYEPLMITHARHSAMVRILEAHLAKGDYRVDDDAGESSKVTVETEKPQEPDWQTFGPDAIIPVHGVITGKARDIPMSTCGCGLDLVNLMIDRAVADKKIKKIIFDFDTPGGSVVGVPETARKIAGIPSSKETISFSDGECCSAGVYLASQCKRSYITGSAYTGSIGVWCAYLDLSRQLANEGQNIQEIAAGKYKTMGAYWKPLTAEERAMVQADVDRIYAEFKEAVRLHREIDDQYMQGQIFDGRQAVEIGLCDGLVDGIEDLLYEGDGD